jgi:hypothetical protein
LSGFSNRPGCVLSRRPVNCYVNVKPLAKEEWFCLLLFLLYSASSSGCGSCGKLGAFLAQSFP